MRRVWVICVRSREVKSTLLRKHIWKFLYEENPYEINPGRPNTEMLVFHDFPLWEPNGLILDYIKTLQHVTPITEVVFYSKAHNMNSELTLNSYLYTLDIGL